MSGGSLVARYARRTVIVLTALMYVYAVVAAVGNLIGMRNVAAAIGVDLTAMGVFWLIAGIALPIVVFGCAWLLSRAYKNWTWLVLLAGLALVAMLQLELLHLIPQTRYLNL